MHPAVAQSLFVRRPSRMGAFILFSIAAHVVVIAVGVALSSFNRAPPIDLDQKPIKASLVRLGKERDKKLLPRQEQLPPPPKEVQAKTAAVAPPEKPAEAIPVPGVKPPPPAPSKQAGTKAGAPEKRSLFDAFSKASTKPEELEGAEDGDALGDSATQEGERYLGLISRQVQRYYDVSSTISEQERMYLRATLRFRISRSGELVGSPTIVKTSGNALFDSAVLAAVKKANPFAPPPEHLRSELQSRGFEVEFTP